MKYVIACACIAFCLACTSPRSTPLDQFFESSPEPVRMLADVDPRVVNFLLDKFDDHQLAKAGQPFQRTDFIKEAGLPWRRFVTAARSGNRWLVVYEHGGFGYHHHVVLVSLEEDPSKLLYSGRGGLWIDSETVQRQIDTGHVEEETKAAYW